MAKGGPDLKRYMDKTLSLKLNGNRTIKVSAAVSAYIRLLYVIVLSVRVSRTWYTFQVLVCVSRNSTHGLRRCGVYLPLIH